MVKYIGLGLTDTTSGSHRLPPLDGNARHDLHLDANKNLVLVYDSEAVSQLAKQRLLTYLGEWFLDITVGVPWFQQIFVRPFRGSISEALIKRHILNTRGVRELVAFDMQINNFTRSEGGTLRDARHLDVTNAEVLTEFDEVVSL
jgi:hypothetical protein